MKEKIDSYFNQNYKKLKYFALSRCRNINDCEDIVNLAYCNCIKYQTNFEKCDDFGAYIGGIIKNLCLDNFNKKKKEIPVSDDFLVLSGTSHENLSIISEEFGEIKIQEKIEKAKIEKTNYQHKNYKTNAELAKIEKAKIKRAKIKIVKIEKRQKNKKLKLKKVILKKKKDILLFKKGKYLEALGNKKHIKILYNNKYLWVKIITKGKDNITGLVETVSEIYMQKIIVNPNHIVGYQ